MRKPRRKTPKYSPQSVEIYDSLQPFADDAAAFEEELGRRYRTYFEKKFRLAKKGAKRRGLSWQLTILEYLNAVCQPCTYCGDPHIAHYDGVGLDRIDNSRGYTPKNVLPCCWLCNQARSDLFSVKEMRSIICLVSLMRGGHPWKE